MKKAVTVNLDGRGFLIEELGYEALQQYLAAAKKALHGDPDQAEILDDLERSLSEKCSHVLTAKKDVVTETNITKILTAMGPVEAAETADDQPATEAGQPTRRLFLISEGAFLLGVCKGLSVYFDVPVALVRVLFIILTLATNIFGLLIYVLLAVILPRADSPETLAEAYGRPTTANQVVDRVRGRLADPDFQRQTSRAVTNVWRCLMWVLTAISAAVLVALTVAGVSLFWAIGLGSTQLHGNLAHFNGWQQWTMAAAAYLALALPAFILCRVFWRQARGQAPGRLGVAVEATLAAVWVVATVGLMMFAVVNHGAVRQYVDTHKGYLDVGTHHVCVDESRCNPQQNWKSAPVPVQPPKPVMVVPAPPQVPLR